MTAMPTNSTERLLAIADRIQFQPETHNQNDFFLVGGSHTVPTLQAAGKAGVFAEEFTCDTTACVAGWAVLYADPQEVYDILHREYPGADEAKLLASEDWSTPGRELLGFTDSLADEVFYIFAGEKAHGHLPEILRRLAKVKPRRTVHHLRKIYDELGLDWS